MSPARLTPPDSSGANSEWVELEDFRTPSHGHGHWGTSPGSHQEPTPPMDLYSTATPSTFPYSRPLHHPMGHLLRSSAASSRDEHWGTPPGSHQEPTPPIDLYSPAT